MKKAARILIVEDLATDAELAQHAIRKVLKGCTFHLVETRKEFLKALETFQPDVILADYALPRFDGITALKLARKHAPLTPLIIWTGANSEDVAVDCLKAGANNYVLKENIKRLGPAVLRALEERESLVARMRAETELLAREIRFRTFVDHASDSFFLHDERGIILDVNHQACESLGYTRQELIGMTPFDVAVNITPTFIKQIGAQLRAGQVVTFDTRHRRKDGSLFPVEVRIRRFQEDGRELAVSLVRDITERKKAEEELQTNEKRFRALIENGLDDISLLAADGTLLWESPSTVRNLGYAPGEYVARNIFEIMHPDDLPWTRNVFARLTQERGGRESGIFRLRRSDGTWRWVEAIATNLLNEPGINAVVINYRDITEREQVEEALREERNLLRTLIDNIPDRIYAMDIHGRKTLSNTADWQACGAKSMEDVIGKTDFDTYPPDLAEGFWQLNRAILESGQAVINHEEPGLDAEGNHVSILTTKIPLRDREGKVVGLVGIGRDITERKQVEERINDLLAFNEKVLNHSGVGILTYKVSGQCVFANEKAASMVGTTVAQLLAQNFRTIKSWKSSGLYDLVEKAITGLSPTADDIHHISTFGKEVWMTVYCISFQVKGEDHVLVSISDITERKQAEEKLRQSENRYRLAVRATNDVIWEANLQSKQLFWSENAQTVFGYTSQEVNSYETWWDDHLHPDDRERLLSKMNSLIEGDETLWMDEYRFQLKNGSYVYISDRGYIERDHHGMPLRMIGAMTDITERKQAEDKLRESENRLFMALSGAQMSVWEWDLKTNQILWSPEFFKITGVNEDQFGGTFESFTDLIHHDDMQRVKNAAENAMREQTLFAEEFRIICPDGEVRWLSNLGQAEYDSTGSYLRLIGTVQDVTQRKQAEIERQALLEIMQGFASTEDLHELLQLIHHAVARVVYAKNFFIVLHQPETGLFEEIYSVDQFDPPAPPDKLEKSITSYVFRTGEPLLLTQVLFDELVQRGEIKLVGTNSVSWLGVPFKTSGRTIGVMVVQDYETDNRYTERDKHFLASIATQVALAIERKQADEALRESEEHYRAIFEGVQDAILVESLDGKILMVNARACEMFGYSQQEFLTKTVRDLVPEGNLILIADGESSLLSLEPQETLNRRANGEIFPIEISGRLQVINGEKVLLVVVRDITERKHAEEEIASLARFPTENPHPILRVQADGRLTYANVSSQDLLEDWNCEVNDYLPEELRDFITVAMDDHLNKTVDVFCKEKVYSIMLVPIVEGGYVNIYGRDITERKRAEEALKHLAEDLRRSNAELEQFAYVASHDLQEPLRMVSSYMQLLKRRYQGKLDKDADEFIAFAVDGATRMQHLINDLLAFSRVGTRGRPMGLSSCEKALAEALINLQVAVEESQAIITHDPLPTVFCDQPQLVQVFQNLIVNSIKFRGQQAPQIHISAKREESEWLFSICDNGIGLDPKFGERIFEIFQRLHSRTAYPGTGIGLAICKRIVQRHGGRIWVESKPGEGATFYFTLPIKETS